MLRSRLFVVGMTLLLGWVASENVTMSRGIICRAGRASLADYFPANWFYDSLCISRWTCSHCANFTDADSGLWDEHTEWNDLTSDVHVRVLLGIFSYGVWTLHTAIQLLQACETVLNRQGWTGSALGACLYYSSEWMNEWMKTRQNWSFEIRKHKKCL